MNDERSSGARVATSPRETWGGPLASAVMTHHDDVMRALVELPAQQLAALDGWPVAHGLSRAEAVRQAVARFHFLLEAEAPGDPDVLVSYALP